MSCGQRTALTARDDEQVNRSEFIQLLLACACVQYDTKVTMSFFLSKEKEREFFLMLMVTSRVEAMFLFSSASYLQGSIK